jgi:LppP/LprE lipoprotein
MTGQSPRGVGWVGRSAVAESRYEALPCHILTMTTIEAVGREDEVPGRLHGWGFSPRALRVVGESIAVVVVVATGSIGWSDRIAPASAQCGPDQASAVWTALAVLPNERVTGRRFASAPLESNYDPCADLSTVLVTIEGATGSSPIQALMFHRGEFLGTGTWKAYGFTSLDAEASTPDTVVLRYRWGQSCTACDDGSVTTVRYHWDGNRVVMLDPPPPG